MGKESVPGVMMKTIIFFMLWCVMFSLTMFFIVKSSNGDTEFIDSFRQEVREMYIDLYING